MDRKSQHDIRLFVDELPEPDDEPGVLDIGLQTKKNEIIAGSKQFKGGWLFEAEVEVILRADDVDFRGPCVHGGPAKRFLYLSWKRQTAEPPFWAQRVKVPLHALAVILANGDYTDEVAFWVDISGRRPHDVDPLMWRIVGD